MLHIAGRGMSEISTITHRGAVVLMPGFDAGLLLELLEACRGTITLAVPTMLQALLDHPNLRSRDVSGLQVVMSGASVVPAELVERTKKVIDCDFSIDFRTGRAARRHLADRTRGHPSRTSPGASAARSHRSR